MAVAQKVHDMWPLFSFVLAHRSGADVFNSGYLQHSLTPAQSRELGNNARLTESGYQATRPKTLYFRQDSQDIFM